MLEKHKVLTILFVTLISQISYADIVTSPITYMGFSNASWTNVPITYMTQAQDRSHPVIYMTEIKSKGAILVLETGDTGLAAPDEIWSMHLQGTINDIPIYDLTNKLHMQMGRVGIFHNRWPNLQKADLAFSPAHRLIIRLDEQTKFAEYIQTYFPQKKFDQDRTFAAVFELESTSHKKALVSFYNQDSLLSFFGIEKQNKGKGVVEWARSCIRVLDPSLQPRVDFTYKKVQKESQDTDAFF